MVRAGKPAGLIAIHALKANHDVLKGVVEGVAHVEPSGDVGGRDDDGKRFFPASGVTYPAFLLPAGEDFGFHRARIVTRRDLKRHLHPPSHALSAVV